MSEFKHLSVNALKDMLDNTTLQIVDIRDPMSFQQGRISGALHLDNASLPAFLASAAPEVPVVVCCYHGNSSQQAAAYLHSQGFQETYSLDGGFAVWSSAYPDVVETD